MRLFVSTFLTSSGLDACGYELAARGNERHARFDAHGHHRGAAHGESGQVGGSDNAAGAHERLARAQRGAGGPHARTGLDGHVVVERYRSVLPNDRLLDHHHGANASGKSSPVSART